jgi:hypothetical protein
MKIIVNFMIPINRFVLRKNTTQIVLSLLTRNKEIKGKEWRTKVWISVQRKRDQVLLTQGYSQAYDAGRVGEIKKII